MAAALLLPGASRAADPLLPPPPPPTVALEATALPKLAVVSFALDDAAGPAARLSYLGEQIAGRMGRHEVMDLVRLLDPAQAAARAARGAQGRADLDQARSLYDELELDRVLALCDKAMKELERADPATFPLFVRAWMLRIAALIANADTAAANAELAQLLPVDQGAAFDPNIFAPDFIAQVKQRREDLMAKGSLSFEVRTRPVAARVFVDGRFRGVSPAEVKNLVPGEHYLTLVAPGYEPIHRKVRPGIGSNVIETLVPTPDYLPFQERIDKIRLDFRGPGRNVAVRELGQKMGADQVLVLGIAQRAPGQLQLLGVRVASTDGHELQYVDEPVLVEEAAFMASADSLLNRLLGSDLKRKEGRAVERTGGGFVWQPRHTGYAVIGAGALALATGILFGVQAMDDASSFAARTEPQTDAVYGQLSSSGKSSALVADLSYLVAAITGGTGAYLVVTGRAGTRDDDGANPKLEERRTVTGRSSADEGARGKKTRRPPPREGGDEAPASKKPRRTSEDEWTD